MNEDLEETKVPSGDKYQPETFWKKLKEELGKIFSTSGWKSDYKSDIAWTPKAMLAAERAILALPGVEIQREYFRVDLIGYERHLPDKYNWTLRVALEHENRDSWPSEVCKLTHVVADLRVIIAYWDFKNDEPIKTVLESCLRNLKNQLLRSGGKWLFVFGPRCKSFGAEYPFVAFKYDGIELVPLSDHGDALNPHYHPS